MCTFPNLLHSTDYSQSCFDVPMAVDSGESAHHNRRALSVG